MKKKKKTHNVHEKFSQEVLVLASISGSYFLVVTATDNEGSLNTILKVAYNYKTM